MNVVNEVMAARGSAACVGQLQLAGAFAASATAALAAVQMVVASIQTGLHGTSPPRATACTPSLSGGDVTETDPSDRCEERRDD